MSSNRTTNNREADNELSGPSTLDTIGAPSTSRAAASPPPPSAAETQSAYAQQLSEVPEFASYGPVLNSSSKPAQLTESETEYQVSCVKHVFSEHIVFQVSGIHFGHDSALTCGPEVQCLQHDPGHCIGTGFGHYAAHDRVRADGRFHHPYSQHISKFTWASLCFIHARHT